VSAGQEREQETVKHISWVAAGGLAAWGAARLAGADRWRALEVPAVPLLSFTPQAAAAAMAGAVLMRRDRAAAVTALAGAALAGAVLPRAFGREQPPARGPVLGVLTANLLVGRAPAEAVVALVRSTGADVLFVQELTGDAAARLSCAGLSRLLPHQVTDARDSSLGSGIYARFALSCGLGLAPVATAQPTAQLELPSGQRVDLVCVHLSAPFPPSLRHRVVQWRDELALLPPPGDPPRVLAGDFNATADHAHFRRLLRLGHADAARETGNGLAPTWGPRGKRALLTLDHVLVDRRCAVLASSVHPLPGTDHRAVYARFQLPA
jgi:endonuclease/exonuclease/phosphatase (EEP) superfamily protein YafD